MGEVVSIQLGLDRGDLGLGLRQADGPQRKRVGNHQQERKKLWNIASPPPERKQRSPKCPCNSLPHRATDRRIRASCKQEGPLKSVVHDVLFFGETLPGYDRSMARIQLQALLGCSPETIRKVFSGERVRLSSGLSAPDAERYELRLKGIGLKVVVDPPLESELLDRRLNVARDGDRPLINATPEVTCPACGHRQAERSHCQACGINMAGYLAARQAEQAAAAAPAEPSGPTPVTGDTPLIGLRFNGRFGRSLYLQTVLLSFTLVNLTLLAQLRGYALVPLLLTTLAGLYFNLRAQICRCHDLGWNGWMSLAQAIPLFGLYVSFKLALWPGDARANRWGAPPRRSLTGLLGALALYIASAVLLGSQIPDDVDLLRELRRPDAVFTQQGPPSPIATRVIFARWADPPPHDTAPAPRLA